ncbi:MATE family efflux transporter [Spirochaeta isovalerica]|uniref:Multidrug-efflux transporter n=1 Tax=Spirochaeta isovalerica TaxID=150 RepID=A0A841RB45_9SPIO|nr:MATE family efflux transporter [Spirochaeta isovalerica]MBB6479898.1 putative MATE family efflux protein [Spirochaeta isovalerica]
MNHFLMADPELSREESKQNYSALFNIALPIMMTNFLQTIYNLTDTYFLGKISREAVGAPSISFNIIFLLILFSMGFTQAGRTLISQSIGKKDRSRAEFYLGQTAGIMVLAGVVLLPLFYFSTPYILKLMAVPHEIFNDTSDYLRIVLYSLPLMLLSFALHGAQEGVGKSIIPLYINIVTISINILLDWLLIFGIGPFPALGVQGAAWATFIARIINALIALALVLRPRDSANTALTSIRLHMSNIYPDRNAWKLIVKIGLPSSLGHSASALGFTVLQGVVNTYGTAVIAAFNLGSRIINLFMMPALGISQAVAVLVGQNLGAKRKDLVFLTLRQALKTVFVLITLSMTITFFYGNRVTGFFINDPEVIAWGKILFRLVSPSVIFFALFTVINGAFQGAGDTRPVAFLNTFRLWGLRLPIAFVLCILLGFGPEGIWYGMIGSNLFTALAGFYLILTRPWTEKLSPDQV